MTFEPLHASTLRRLVRHAKKGDTSAFEDLARSCEKTLYRVAASCLSGNEADIADALQDTLISAWRSIGTLENPRYFKTWLVRICINSCNRLHRTRKPFVPLDSVGDQQLDNALRLSEHTDDDACSAYQSQSNAAFQELVATAGSAHALVITLYYGEGYSTAEIAELLGTTPENVRQRLARGRKRIAQALNVHSCGLQADVGSKVDQQQAGLKRPRAPAEDNSHLNFARTS